MKLIIVGIGWAGEAHFRAVGALQPQGVDCRVAALVDVDADHLARQASELGVKATFTDLPSALEACPEADAVVLSTPHHLHREAAEQAAAAGRHVLVEKPIALTLEDADAMIQACDQAGTTLMVAESARYSRATLAMADAIAAGKIGQVLSGRINPITRGRHTYAYPGRRAWLADPAVGGSGIWMLNGIHHMSVARALLGEPTRIYARQVRSDKFTSPLEATIVALLSFTGGAEATMTVSAELHGYKRLGDTAIFGSDGTMLLRRGEPAELEIYTDDGRETIECAEDAADEASGAFVRQMREFMASVAGSREPLTGGRSERRTLRAILGGYESVRTGQPVDLTA